VPNPDVTACLGKLGAGKDNKRCFCDNPLFFLVFFFLVLETVCFDARRRSFAGTTFPGLGRLVVSLGSGFLDVLFLGRTHSLGIRVHRLSRPLSIFLSIRRLMVNLEGREALSQLVGSGELVRRRRRRLPPGVGIGQIDDLYDDKTKSIDFYLQFALLAPISQYSCLHVPTRHARSVSQWWYSSVPVRSPFCRSW
jgi:hypothetical protein